jgi:hypothetical protein
MEAERKRSEDRVTISQTPAGRQPLEPDKC